MPHTHRMVEYVSAGCKAVKDSHKFVELYIKAIDDDPCVVCDLYEDCNCEIKTTKKLEGNNETGLEHNTGAGD